jgi:hypothetical protein
LECKGKELIVNSNGNLKESAPESTKKDQILFISLPKDGQKFADRDNFFTIKNA